MAHNDVSFLFDLDGTLVDSVYQHVLAWQEALHAANIDLAVWRIHRDARQHRGSMNFAGLMPLPAHPAQEPALAQRSRR